MAVLRSLSMLGLPLNSPSAVYNSHFDLDFGCKTPLYFHLSNKKIVDRNKPRCQKPRNLQAKFLDTGFSGVNLRSEKFIVRTKSVLSVDEAVESDGDRTAGGSEEKSHYDAIVIGSGIGGLVASTQLAVKGAKVLVLEKYVIPGGSSGYYQRDGYTFDVGSSVMFGFSDKVSSLIIVVTYHFN